MRARTDDDEGEQDFTDRNLGIVLSLSFAFPAAFWMWYFYVKWSKERARRQAS